MTEPSGETLIARFRSAWSAPGELPCELGPRLIELCVAARSAHPAIALEDGDFVAELAARAPTDPGALDDYLRRCRASELWLAVAASRGHEAAITELEQTFRSTIDAVCRRFVRPEQPVEDLRQLLRTKLFVSEVGRRPKIGDYAGQGFLENWLRVTAVRLFLDLAKRKDRSRESPAHEDDVLALPSPGDLELDVVKAEYRAVVAEAMRDAAQDLEPGDRHLLRQHLVGGLSIDQLGAVLGIHRATAARRIARAREKLVMGTRRSLATRLGLKDHELDEVIGTVMSRLDVSISKLLASRVVSNTIP